MKSLLTRRHFLRSSSALIATSVLAITACLLQAAEPTLHVGDPAPKLVVGSWVQGEPIAKLETGKAYLIEL